MFKGSYIILLLPFFLAWCLILFPALFGHHHHELIGSWQGFESWLIMIIAMMWPLLIVPALAVTQRSLSMRSTRNTAMMTIGYGTVWAATALPAWIVLTAYDYLHFDPRIGTLIGCIIAAVWQVSPLKRDLALKCNPTPHFPNDNSKRLISMFSFGAKFAKQCVLSTFLLMVPPMFGGHGILLMGILLILMMAERAISTPDFRMSAIILIGYGISTFLLS